MAPRWASTTPRQEREAEKTGRSEERIRDLIKRLLEKSQNRLDKYEQFLKKVESRRDKLLEKGHDVGRINSFLDTARLNLAKTQTAIDSAGTALASIDTSQSMRDTIQDIQTEMTKIRKSFTELHRSMNETVKALKEISRETTPTHTPRPTRVVTPRGGNNGQR